MKRDAQNKFDQFTWLLDKSCAFKKTKRNGINLRGRVTVTKSAANLSGTNVLTLSTLPITPVGRHRHARGRLAPRRRSRPLQYGRRETTHQPEYNAGSEYFNPPQGHTLCGRIASSKVSCYARCTCRRDATDHASTLSRAATYLAQIGRTKREPHPP
jgi:hypothetical protein